MSCPKCNTPASIEVLLDQCEHSFSQMVQQQTRRSYVGSLEIDCKQIESQNAYEMVLKVVPFYYHVNLNKDSLLK